MATGSWETLALLCVLLLLAVLALPLRRALLRRRGVELDCSLRLALARDGRGWMIGAARYSGDVIEWYRVFSYSPRPKRVIPRRDLVVCGRRTPVGQERNVLLAGHVLECRQGGQPFEMAMSSGSLTGFLSWMESAPPGTDVS